MKKFISFSNNFWLVFAILFAFSAMTTSCSDDDDNDGPSPSGNFNAESESYDAKIEGDYSAEMKGGQAGFENQLPPFFNPQQYDSTEDAGMTISLGDTTKEESNELLILIYKNDADQVDEGTYDIKMQDDQEEIKTGSGVLFSTPAGASDFTQSPDNDGSISLNSISENEVTGTINDVELVEQTQDENKGSATINGEFNAVLAD